MAGERVPPPTGVDRRGFIAGATAGAVGAVGGPVRRITSDHPSVPVTGSALPGADEQEIIVQSAGEPSELFFPPSAREDELSGGGAALIVPKGSGALDGYVPADAALMSEHTRRGGDGKMATIGQPYTSGNWVTEAGKEAEFIERWTAFTQWSLENAPGAQEFVLIQDSNDPRHFMSFGAWSDGDAVKTWRQAPEFGDRLGECRALCEHFEAHDFTVAASPG